MPESLEPIDRWPKGGKMPKSQVNYHKPFDPLWYRDADMNDPAQVLKARESAIQEQYIRLMRSKIIREEMEKCQLRAGQDALKVCKYWTELYLQATERGDNILRGWKGIERREIFKN